MTNAQDTLFTNSLKLAKLKDNQESVIEII